MEITLFMSLLFIVLYQRYKLREAKQFITFLQNESRAQRRLLIGAKLQMNDANLYFEKMSDFNNPKNKDYTDIEITRAVRKWILDFIKLFKSDK